MHSGRIGIVTMGVGGSAEMKNTRGLGFSLRDKMTAVRDNITKSLSDSVCTVCTLFIAGTLY